MAVMGRSGSLRVRPSYRSACGKSYSPFLCEPLLLARIDEVALQQVIEHAPTSDANNNLNPEGNPKQVAVQPCLAAQDTCERNDDGMDEVDAVRAGAKPQHGPQPAAFRHPQINPAQPREQQQEQKRDDRTASTVQTTQIEIVVSGD